MEERGLLLSDVIIAIGMFALAGLAFWGAVNLHSDFDPHERWDFIYLILSPQVPFWFCLGIGALRLQKVLWSLIGAALTIPWAYFLTPLFDYWP